MDQRSRHRRCWNRLGLVAAASLLAATTHRPADACSPAIPTAEELSWPSTIPVEGVIVVFTGEGAWGLPNLAARFTVVGPDGTEFPGNAETYLGSEAVGDLLVWRANAALDPGTAYTVTLQFADRSSTQSVVTAEQPTAPPDRPRVHSHVLTEAPVAAEQDCCEVDSCVECVVSRYDYPASMVLSWSEPQGALDRRLTRYRWSVQEPDGSLTTALFEATQGDHRERETTLAFSGAEGVDELCLVLEAVSLVDGQATPSEPLCRRADELIEVDHDQPPPVSACPGEASPNPDLPDEGSADPQDGPGGCAVARPGSAGSAWLFALFAVPRIRRRRRFG